MTQTTCSHESKVPKLDKKERIQAIPQSNCCVQVQGLEIRERKDFSRNLPIKEVTQILKVGAEAYLIGDPAGERIGAGVEVKKTAGPEKASWEGPSEEIVVEEDGLEGGAVAEVGWDGS